MSDGMRSGVNWMRLNDRSMASASVRIMSVLASPGTPTSRQWPWANRAMSSCSRTSFWPTMTLAAFVEDAPGALAEPVGSGQVVRLEDRSVGKFGGAHAGRSHFEAVNVQLPFPVTTTTPLGVTATPAAGPAAGKVSR